MSCIYVKKSKHHYTAIVFWNFSIAEYKQNIKYQLSFSTVIIWYTVSIIAKGRVTFC